jgi:hypothetical protein
VGLNAGSLYPPFRVFESPRTGPDCPKLFRAAGPRDIQFILPRLVLQFATVDNNVLQRAAVIHSFALVQSRFPLSLKA